MPWALTGGRRTFAFFSASAGTAIATATVSNTGIVVSSGYGVSGYSQAQAYANSILLAKGGHAVANTTVYNGPSAMITSLRTGLYGGAKAYAGGYSIVNGTGGTATATVSIVNLGQITITGSGESNYAPGIEGHSACLRQRYRSYRRLWRNCCRHDKHLKRRHDHYLWLWQPGHLRQELRRSAGQRARRRRHGDGAHHDYQHRRRPRQHRHQRQQLARNLRPTPMPTPRVSSAAQAARRRPQRTSSTTARLPRPAITRTASRHNLRPLRAATLAEPRGLRARRPMCSTPRRSSRWVKAQPASTLPQTPTANGNVGAGYSGTAIALTTVSNSGTIVTGVYNSPTTRRALLRNLMQRRGTTRRDTLSPRPR